MRNHRFLIAILVLAGLASLIFAIKVFGFPPYTKQQLPIQPRGAPPVATVATVTATPYSSPPTKQKQIVLAPTPSGKDKMAPAEVSPPMQPQPVVSLPLNFSPAPAISPPPPPAPNSTPTPSPAPEQTTPPPPQPIKKSPMNTLEIFSPIGSKGLGREYLARAEVLDEANYIEIGLIIRDENGTDLNGLTVEITATDKTQNKTLQGTGNIRKIYVDGNEQTVHYYPFHYEFKTAGDHTITFKAGDVTKSVTVTAEKDTRP